MGIFEPKLDGIKDNPTFLSALVRGTDEGKPVKVSANSTVALCASQDDIVGVVRSIDPADKAAVVQVRGFVTLLYTGTAPTVGILQRLVGDGSGGVVLKTAGAALGDKYYQIADVDTTNTLVTFFLA